MYHIEKSLQQFIQAVKARQPIVLEDSGQWTVAPMHFYKIKKWLGLTEKNAALVVQSFLTILDRLESIPVLFSDSSNTITQKVDFRGFLSAGNELFSLVSDPFNPIQLELQEKLTRRLIALKYRLGTSNGGIDKLYSSETVHGSLDKASFNAPFLPDLLHIAAQWKETQKNLNEHNLTIQDIEKIHEVGVYEEFEHCFLKAMLYKSNFLNGP